MKSVLLIVSISICLFACQQGPGEKDENSTATKTRPSLTDIYGPTWITEQIDGLKVTTSQRATIKFENDGHVTGTTGCNRFSGMAKINGQNITFGQFATTRRACIPELMEQEQKFLEAIENIKKYSIDKNSLLRLNDSENKELMVLSGNNES